MECNLEQESVMMEIAKIKALELKFNTKIVTWVAAQVCNLNNLQILLFKFCMYN